MQLYAVRLSVSECVCVYVCVCQYKCLFVSKLTHWDVQTCAAHGSMCSAWKPVQYTKAKIYNVQLQFVFNIAPNAAVIQLYSGNVPM